jgi:hypothetical protein
MSAYPEYPHDGTDWEMQEAAEAELAFLKSLLPAEAI